MFLGVPLRVGLSVTSPRSIIRQFITLSVFRSGLSTSIPHAMHSAAKKHTIIRYINSNPRTARRVRSRV